MIIEPYNKSTKDNPVGRFMVAAGAVIEFQTSGKILLLKRNVTLDWHPSEWEIGYGRLDQFEDIETGLQREVFEETGLKHIKTVKALRIWHIFRGSQIKENELIGITFHCRTTKRIIRLSEEHVEYQWVFPEKALHMVHVNGIKKDIEMFQKFWGKK